MSRGVIYYVTKDKEQAVCFNENIYQYYLSDIGADYVKDQTEEESEAPLKALDELMTKMGAAVKYDNSPDSFKFAFRFEKVEQAVLDYFRPKYEKLKAEMDRLTLSEAVYQAPKLDYIMNDVYADMVMLVDESSEQTITFDNFIRELEPRVTFYVYKKVLLIH